MLEGELPSTPTNKFVVGGDDMGLSFQILGSSSAGNCALLCSASCRVLIDAGFSARKIATLLEATGLKLADLDAVFITHEHNDHVQGLAGLARQKGIRFFANRGTAESINGEVGCTARWQLFETGTTFAFSDLRVTSFSIPHDATDPVGFVFSCESGKEPLSPPLKLAWVTDLGYIPQLVAARVKEVHLLVLEANYDKEMLERDEKRPWSLKQRIKSRHGHLSNEAAAAFVQTQQDARWRKVFLAHLSRECNEVELVRRQFELPGMLPRGCQVTVVDPRGGPLPQCPLTIS